MVDWVDAALDSPAPASDAAVRLAERLLRVPLPIDFLSVARAHQGAAPAPARVDLPNGLATAVSHLLHFEDGFSNIVTRRFPVEGVLEKGFIPFAEDIGGDLFCFNYRTDFDAPPVVFWSVDTGAVPVADSFSEFVAQLHA